MMLREYEFLEDFLKRELTPEAYALWVQIEEAKSRLRQLHGERPCSQT